MKTWEEIYTSIEEFYNKYGEDLEEKNCELIAQITDDISNFIEDKYPEFCQEIGDWDLYRHWHSCYNGDVSNIKEFLDNCKDSEKYFLEMLFDYNQLNIFNIIEMDRYDVEHKLLNEYINNRHLDYESVHTNS